MKTISPDTTKVTPSPEGERHQQKPRGVQSQPLLEVLGGIILSFSALLGCEVNRDTDKHTKNGTAAVEGNLDLSEIVNALPHLEQRLQDALAANDTEELKKIPKEAQKFLDRIQENMRSEEEQMGMAKVKALLRGISGDAYFAAGKMAPAYSMYGCALFDVKGTADPELLPMIAIWEKKRGECELGAEEENKKELEQMIARAASAPHP